MGIPFHKTLTALGMTALTSGLAQADEVTDVFNGMVNSDYLINAYRASPDDFVQGAEKGLKQFEAGTMMQMQPSGNNAADAGTMFSLVCVMGNAPAGGPETVTNMADQIKACAGKVEQLKNAKP